MPRARRFFLSLVGIYVVCANVAILGSVLLVSFGLEFTSEQVLYGLGVAALSTPVILATDIGAIWWQARPVLDWLDDPAAPIDTAQVRALNLPLYTAARVMFLHGPVSLGCASVGMLGVMNPMFGAGFQVWQIVLMWAMLFVTVAAHAIFEYFWVLRAVRPVIAAMPVRGVPGVIRVRLGTRLLAVSFFATFVPLVVLAATVLFKLAPAGVDQALYAWIAALIGISTVVTGVMAVLTERQLTWQAGRLVQAMADVQQGTSDAVLAVDSADEFAELAMGFNDMVRGLQQRDRLRDGLGRYVPPVEAERIMERGPQLGGEAVEVTVLALSIHNLADATRDLAPADAVAFLNGWLEAVAPAIRAHGGWVDRFGGDRLQAVFGAPVVNADHPAAAVAAARQIQQAVGAFNTGAPDRGWKPLRCGLGLHCGEVVAGTVGTPERMEFTAVGEPVQLAWQLEHLTRTYAAEIIVSEAVRSRAGNVPASPLPGQDLMGRDGPIEARALSAPS